MSQSREGRRDRVSRARISVFGEIGNLHTDGLDAGGGHARSRFELEQFSISASWRVRSRAPGRRWNERSRFIGRNGMILQIRLSTYSPVSNNRYDGCIDVTAEAYSARVICVISLICIDGYSTNPDRGDNAVANYRRALPASPPPMSTAMCNFRREYARANFDMHMVTREPHLEMVQDMDKGCVASCSRVP